MATKAIELFTAHPKTVGETYFEHLRFALGFSGRMFYAAGAALVHAFLPFLFVSTASTIVSDMHGKNTKRFDT